MSFVNSFFSIHKSCLQVVQVSVFYWVLWSHRPRAGRLWKHQPLKIFSRCCSSRSKLQLFSTFQLQTISPLKVNTSKNGGKHVYGFTLCFSSLLLFWKSCFPLSAKLPVFGLARRGRKARQVTSSHIVKIFLKQELSVPCILWYEMDQPENNKRPR